MSKGMASCETSLAVLIEMMWRVYARPRYPFKRKTTTAAEHEAWLQFVRTTARLYALEAAKAEAAGERPDYSVAELRYLALRAVGAPCTYCNRVFSLQGFGLSYRIEPATAGAGPGAKLFRYRNLLVCCGRCALAKGRTLVSSTVLLDVVAALRQQPEWIVERVLTLLAVGPAAAAKVLPGPPPPRVTRSARRVRSGTAKK